MKVLSHREWHPISFKFSLAYLSLFLSGGNRLWAFLPFVQLDGAVGIGPCFDIPQPY